jgi:hypothetical protein
MGFIKTYFLPLLIVVLLAIIFFQRCNRRPPTPPEIVIEIDTVWVPHDSLIYSEPEIIHSEPTIVKDTEYVANPNYDILKKQYDDLADKFLTKNSYLDKIQVDSIGYVQVDEIVYKNEILNRQLSYKLDYPVITKTINTYSNRTQVYGGIHLQGNKNSLIDQVHGGFLLKTKRDQIYGVYAGPDFDGHMNYGVQLYWKIKL